MRTHLIGGLAQIWGLYRTALVFLAHITRVMTLFGLVYGVFLYGTGRAPTPSPSTYAVSVTYARWRHLWGSDPHRLVLLGFFFERIRAAFH
jgi:hypothetical protein